MYWSLQHSARGTRVVLTAALLVAGTTRAAKPPGEAFTYDDSAYRRTDPALRRWLEQTPLRPDVPSPAGLCVTAHGRIVVAGDRAVAAFDADGRPAWRAELEEAARGVASDPDGRVLVGLRRHLEVLDAEGKAAATWPDLGEEAVITSIAAGRAIVFVADGGQRALWKFDAKGRLLGRIGDKDPARGREGWNVPSPHFDVALASDGSLWAANPGELRLEHFSPDGKLLGHWGRPGFAIDAFCGCCNPADFALRKDGGFVTAEKGLPRVKTYDAEGRFTGVVAGPEDFDEDTVGTDVAEDARGRILVLDPKRKLVRIFAPKPEAKP